MASTQLISADSHVCEPPDAFVSRIDPRYRDRAPRIVNDPARGDVYVVEGSPRPIPLSLVSAAGKRADELSPVGAVFGKLHRGGWDPDARLADQDVDGIVAEVIYPSVGMEICGLKDLDYKKACMDAYNLWIAEFCAAHPDRLVGLGQTPMRGPQEAIGDLGRIKDLGLRGVMLPGVPGQDDYHSPIYDPFWEAAVGLNLPLSFHILTSGEGMTRNVRGGKINSFMGIIRSNQDIISMLTLDGVFQRHPKLRIVCVEADAGWAPHFMYRMDHAYRRHRHWLEGRELERQPSEYFAENVYLTFQDDRSAFQVKDHLNLKRIMWANDYPHSDSTWPHSREVLAEHTAGLTQQEFDLVVRDNVAELYGLTL